MMALYYHLSTVLSLSSVVVMLMGGVLYLPYLPYLCIRFRRGSGALVRLLLPLLLWTATGSPPGVYLFSASLLSALSLPLFLSLFAVMEVMPPKPCAFPVFGGFANEAVHDRCCVAPTPTED